MTQPATVTTEHVMPPSAAQRAADDDAFSVLRIVTICVRHLWLIVGMSGLLAVIVLVAGLNNEKTWSSDATFIPQGSRAPSAVSSLAAQFGLGVGVVEASQSPQFYVDFITSREALRAVVRDSYTVHTDTGVVTGDLVKLYGIRSTPADSLGAEMGAMAKLKRSVNTTLSSKTAVITLRAKSPYPELSAQIVRNFLAEINKFNNVGRQLRASAERKFVGERLADAESTLAAAENNLEAFNSSNRDVGSPSLQLRRERLGRVVATRQQVYTALAQAYEQSKIEELRDTPAITVIDPPVVPLELDPRGMVRDMVKGLILGAVLGVMLALLLDYLRRSGGGDSEALQELLALSREVFRRPLRVLGR